jgi:hypothetical protein
MLPYWNKPEVYPDKFQQKAKDCIRSHATKAGLSIDNFCLTYRWSIKQLAKDFADALYGKCPYGHEQFSTLLYDLTIDIMNPNEPPDYGLNTRIVCRRCNCEKGGKTLAEYARWKARFRGQLKLF